MARKCYKCGSSRVAKVVPASALCIPEIKNDVEEGRAVVNCCCGGNPGGGVYRCLDCNFQWDRYYEISVEQDQK